MYQYANTDNGFSLVELLVALAVAGILMAIAMPSFNTFMASNKMTAVNNSLVQSLQTARSEAVERLSSVGVCTSSSPMAIAATCNTGAGYGAGWIVYVDENGDGAHNGAEEIVHREDKLSNAFAITPDVAFANQVYFNDSGNSTNGAGVPISGQINLNYGGGQQLREITVSANGRVSTETP